MSKPPSAASDSTQIDSDSPWSQASSQLPARFCLTVCWCDSEAERVGQSAIVARSCTLGRGIGDGHSSRLEFVEQRPGAGHPRGGLNTPKLSRTQLKLIPDGDTLQVENVGRPALLHNGGSATRVSARAGDTLSLLDTAVFLVELRQPLWPDTLARGLPGFGFGSRDALGFVGESAAAWQLRNEIVVAARANAHVLVHGPTGAGKEATARALHQLSERARGPFISRNAATLPPGLIDAELFGNIKNYPNAGSPERPGLVGEASGGTLLLDEIGELPAAEQAHFLRMLDRGGEYQRLGDGKPRRADLRVVAITNRDPSDLKHDFVARFPIRLRVPGLAERKSDIPLLIRAWCAERLEQEPELAVRFERAPGVGAWQPLIEPALIERLLRHSFPGNHRELEKLMWIALSTSSQRHIAVTPELLEALGPEPIAEAGNEPLNREALIAALAAVQGSPTLAARRLGLKNRHVLYRLMKKFGLDPKD